INQTKLKNNYTLMYKMLTFNLILLAWVTLPSLAQTTEFISNKPFRLNAAVAEINTQSSEKVTDERLSNKQGVTLKSGIEQAIEGERDEPDLIFRVKAPDAGRYVMHSYAVTDEEGAALMKKASSKYESMYMRIQIDDKRATKRVVYVPWDRPLQRAGRFALTGEQQEIKIWLPRGVRLEYLHLQTYVPPKVPDAAVNYKPTMTPPASHPRIL